MRIVLFSVVCLVLSACGNTSQVALESLPNGPNVLPVTVGNCGPSGYLNEPCASVTICTPGTSACQTVDNLLVDTGSYGLRVFSSVLGIGLNHTVDGSGRTVAECTSYADGSSDWGPVAVADVELGSERADSVPIQLIDSTFPGIAQANCDSNPDISPSQAGFNGILGVGLFTSDCGSNCASDSSNGVYYVCSGANCTGSTLAESNQVSNPVSFLPTDNNGVGLLLPAVYSNGAISAQGGLILGIGTETNNVPSGTATMAADTNGDFTTTFYGQTYNDSGNGTGSFIDSGSNEYYFPNPGALAECSGQNSGLYCPSSLTSLNAVQISSSNNEQIQVLFYINNADYLLNSNFGVFNDIGAPVSDGFAWGLPFFLGRTVWVGISGKSSPVGEGPYWAY